jgi:hypothetical protein
VAAKPKTNRATETLKLTQIIVGITKYITAALVIAGKSMTQQALLAVFQDALQADKDLDAARAVVSAKLQARRAAYATARSLDRAIKKQVEVTYGPDSPVLKDFGFAEAKPPRTSSEVKAESARKGRATRAAKKAALKAVTAKPAPGPATPKS